VFGKKKKKKELHPVTSLFKPIQSRVFNNQEGGGLGDDEGCIANQGEKKRLKPEGSTPTSTGLEGWEMEWGHGQNSLAGGGTIEKKMETCG